MHSRIYQISKTPIDRDDYIDEGHYYDHWFTNSIADYVNGDTDREDDINWLKSYANAISFDSDDNGEYFIVTSKEEYFKEKFEAFHKFLDIVKGYTLQDFASGIYEMWGLKDAYEDKFGFYVDADGELMNFDSFVRRCVINEKYYIGGTIDYHF